MRRILALAVVLATLPLVAAVPVASPEAPAEGVLAVDEDAAPSVVVLTQSGSVFLSGSHREGFRGYDTTGNMACAITPGPNTVTATCVPSDARLRQCLSWQAIASGSGVGFVTGTATCDGAAPSMAFAHKPGTGVGPVVTGPAPFPLVCTADWRGDFGDWRVECRYTWA